MNRLCPGPAPLTRDSAAQRRREEAGGSSGGWWWVGFGSTPLPRWLSTLEGSR